PGHHRTLGLVFQRADRDVQDGRSLFMQALKIAPDHWLPSVRLEPRLLLGGNGALFEIAVWPPMHTGMIEVHGLGEDLVAVAAQGIDVDLVGHDRPEAPIPGLIPQVARLVGGADECTLPWRVYFLASPWRPIAFDLPNKECLKVIDFGSRIGI